MWYFEIVSSIPGPSEDDPFYHAATDNQLIINLDMYRGESYSFISNVGFDKTDPSSRDGDGKFPLVLLAQCGPGSTFDFLMRTDVYRWITGR